MSDTVMFLYLPCSGSVSNPYIKEIERPKSGYGFDLASKVLPYGSTFYERVKTFYDGLVLYVHETGLLLDLPQNNYASGTLYPGTIYGDVILVQEDLIYTNEGPDYTLRNFHSNTLDFLVRKYNLNAVCNNSSLTPVENPTPSGD